MVSVDSYLHLSIFTMKLLRLTFALCVVIHEAHQSQLLKQLDAVILKEAWSDFKTQQRKYYSSSLEETFRFTNFVHNLKDIEVHNYLFDMGLMTFRMGINHLSDMTFPEVIEQMTGLIWNKNMTTEGGTGFVKRNEVILPAAVDWRDKGYVTSVKNQGKCGSCWAFSSTGSLEGQTKKKTGSLVSLSEQNLVDCSTAQGNSGCNGGFMSKAFTYIRQNGGIDTAASYPYEAKNLSCRYKVANKGATVSGHVFIDSGNEEMLKKAVATIGPISSAINVQPSFQKYQSGIYYDPNCDPLKLNHAILVVGYGTEMGKDFWIVKNSWSTIWGEQGYFRIARNKQNHCGIATAALYPVV